MTGQKRDTASRPLRFVSLQTTHNTAQQQHNGQTAQADTEDERVMATAPICL